MLKKYLIGIAIGIYLFCFGCSAPINNRITQTSTIDALLAGLYDGNISCRELLRYGDLGIGTFDRLEGEMIMMNGKIYQVKADGNVYTPDLNIKTPFASVCKFSADVTIPLSDGLDYDALEKLIDQSIPNQNLFYAIRIEGKFARMKTRSVPAQRKPYLPLAEVTKNQPEFSMENVSGTIVGFRCPPYVKGINVPGYHLHFISSDFKQGGHVLRFEITSGACDIDLVNQFLLILPEDQEAFKKMDLSKDRSKELEQVEK
jgi:acetolactate decarboxylase